MFINNFDPVAFQIFSFEIRWYSLAYIFGIVFGFFAFMMVLQLIFTHFIMPETKGVSLEDLSKKFNISRERIRQIENKAFEKLQKHMLNSAKSKNLLPAN